MTKPQPFTWDAFWEEESEDPDFDLFERFTFDHLSDGEIQAIADKMRVTGQAYSDEADALLKDHYGENVEFIFPKGEISEAS